MPSPSSSPRASSFADLESSPSSVPSLRVIGHELIVSAKGAPRKCTTTSCSGVQFAERVRRFMQVHGLTIRSAAREWGYAERTVAAWRSGKSEPKWSEWQAIEQAAMGRTGTR